MYQPVSAIAHLGSVAPMPTLIPTDAAPVVRNSKRSPKARATTLQRKAIRGLKYNGGK